jgi:hypothetical protein
MITLEQVEQLRAKADVSYDEAKEALEAAGGDILEALIALEKKGKVTPPEGGGYYNSARHDGAHHENAGGSTINDKKSGSASGETFGDLMKRFWKFICKIVHFGNVNTFEIHKDGEYKSSLPITILVILILFAFWISVPLIIIGLFFGFRYRFSGPDINKTPVNNVMDTAADTAEDIKRSFKNSNNQ